MFQCVPALILNVLMLNMKDSMFNSCLPYKGNYVMHNGYSDQFMLVHSDLIDLYKAGLAHGNIEELREIHPEFYSQLVEHEFLVDDSLDEVRRIVELSNEIDRGDSVYIMTINPTMGCNFKCWYCYESHINGSKMKDVQIHSVLKHIEMVVMTQKNLKFFSLNFFGGEPLIYFDQVVVPLIEGATEILRDTDIILEPGFTTNGYLIDDVKIEFFKKHRVNHFQITLDGGEEEHNKVRYITKERGSYRTIVDNIFKLCANELGVKLRINYTIDNYESCIDIVDDFKSMPLEDRKILTVGLHRVWQDSTKGELSVSLLTDEFMELGIDVTPPATNINNVVNSCYADKYNSCVVNYNGNVFKCTARDFTEGNRDGYLNEDGIIIWNESKYEKRMNAKFKNEPCLECRLLPICNGGCSQHAFENLENENGYCVFGFDETRKDNLLLERFRVRVQESEYAI